ncbi:MAG: hypothetical protein EPO08_20575 [Rhodospirillaceae bacterium]|nr:MAG: hypothetical protein EPO08_20575 [Rhodospirillaceae bacterium]
MKSQLQLLAEKLTDLNARMVFTIDANNVWAAWRDQGTYKGRAYDKYRIGPLYWSSRDNAWQQGNGSIGVPFERKGDLLEAFARLNADYQCSLKLATMAS